jgi:hypothetical protein
LTSRAAALVLLLGLAGAAAGSERDLPVIVDVAVPPRLHAGVPGELRVAYRAPLANVVSIVEIVDHLDGPDGAGLVRASRQRELSVVGRAFGYEAGELRVPVAFASPGRKRITLTLVTEERDESDPAVVELDVVP